MLTAEKLDEVYNLEDGIMHAHNGLPRLDSIVDLCVPHQLAGYATYQESEPASGGNCSERHQYSLYSF